MLLACCRRARRRRRPEALRAAPTVRSGPGRCQARRRRTRSASIWSRVGVRTRRRRSQRERCAHPADAAPISGGAGWGARDRHQLTRAAWPAPGKIRARSSVMTSAVQGVPLSRAIAVRTARGGGASRVGASGHASVASERGGPLVAAERRRATLSSTRTSTGGPLAGASGPAPRCQASAACRPAWRVGANRRHPTQEQAALLPLRLRLGRAGLSSRSPASRRSWGQVEHRLQGNVRLLDAQQRGPAARPYCPRSHASRDRPGYGLVT